MKHGKSYHPKKSKKEHKYFEYIFDTGNDIFVNSVLNRDLFFLDNNDADKQIIKIKNKK